MSSYFDVKYNFDYGVFALTKFVNFSTTQTLITDVFGLFFWLILVLTDFEMRTDEVIQQRDIILLLLNSFKVKM